MPSTRSRAATKCISEVPGLVKQTSTPPATRVRTRLSAPFILQLPLAIPAFSMASDQSFLKRFVKGVGKGQPGSQAHGCYRRYTPSAILTAPFEIRHLCLRKHLRYGLLDQLTLPEESDDPDICLSGRGV